MIPYNVWPNELSHLKLWRLADGNFRILQDGEFTILIINGVVLVEEKLLPIFKRLPSEELSLTQRTILDQETNQIWSNYYELEIKNSIDPKTINQISSKGLKVWHYRGGGLFVSPELKEILQMEYKDLLQFSKGFEFYA